MKLEFTIEGTSDLMTHNPISMFMNGSGKPGKAKKEPTREEVAELACYRLADGSCAVPVLAPRGAMIEAAKSFKLKGSRSSLGALLTGCEVEPMEHVPIMRDGKPVTEYVIDSRRAVNKNTKGAIIVHRPKFAAGWRITFSIILDDGLFKISDEEVRETLTEVLNDAGMRKGIGSYRPAKGGWFGRFKVV